LPTWRISGEVKKKFFFFIPGDKKKFMQILVLTKSVKDFAIVAIICVYHLTFVYLHFLNTAA
jgi:hypothetical protein